MIIGILKLLVFLIAILLIVSFIYEQYARRSLEHKLFQGKTFVNVFGKPLHYVKEGEGKTSVVFVSGTGSSHVIWQEIQAKVARNAVTLSYDRAGILASEDAGMSVTNEHVSEELEVLLQQTNCQKPYILVAHSMAGIYLRPFIRKHAADIAGIVLVESAHPKMVTSASPALRKARKIPSDWLIHFAVQSGMYRLLFHFQPLSVEIPMQHPLHKAERNFFYRSYRKLLEELANESENFKDAEKYADFGNIPLTVIVGTSSIRYQTIQDVDVRKEYERLITTLQQDLLTLSSNSRFVEAPNSGHLVQLGDPAIIVTEIDALLKNKRMTL